MLKEMEMAYLEKRGTWAKTLNDGNGDAKTLNDDLGSQF
jgi:hypothetical protein